jgi:inner membrane protein
VRVEERYRGIYKVQVYRAIHRLTGVFHVPVRLGLAEGRDLVDADPASLVFGVSDSRGLRRPPSVRLNGVETAVEPGTHLRWLEQGFAAQAGPLLETRVVSLPFEIEIELVGTDRLSFVPVGASTHAEMESEWPHPSFTGGFLPDERHVDARGFRATWQLSRYATGVDGLIERLRQGAKPELGTCDFGVRFITPVDIYQQSERAVKYGMLFVMLTFVAFFLFEVLRRMAVHPIQYGLAGAALALFFLLLVSLSEHLPFAVAYLTASGACVGLLAFYVGHVLHSAARGLGFGGLLAGLYAVLYVLLLSEDYALLLGSLLLFVVVGAVMIMTRRVDWYRAGDPQAP